MILAEEHRCDARMTDPRRHVNVSGVFTSLRSRYTHLTTPRSGCRGRKTPGTSQLGRFQEQDGPWWESGRWVIKRRRAWEPRAKLQLRVNYPMFSIEKNKHKNPCCCINLALSPVHLRATHSFSFLLVFCYHQHPHPRVLGSKEE